jgi:hypothetical protein
MEEKIQTGNTEVQIGALYRLDTNRKFFIDFAVSSGFDPLNPENWYSIPRQRMLGYKVH